MLLPWNRPTSQAVDRHVRNEAGDAVLRRQFRPNGTVFERFFETNCDGSPNRKAVSRAIVEVCGFQRLAVEKCWLNTPAEKRCLIQVKKRSKKEKPTAATPISSGGIFVVETTPASGAKASKEYVAYKPPSAQGRPGSTDHRAAKNGWGNFAHGRSTRAAATRARATDRLGLDHENKAVRRRDLFSVNW